MRKEGPLSRVPDGKGKGLCKLSQHTHPLLFFHSPLGHDLPQPNSRKQVLPLPPVRRTYFLRPITASPGFHYRFFIRRLLSSFLTQGLVPKRAFLCSCYPQLFQGTGSCLYSFERSGPSGPCQNAVNMPPVTSVSRCIRIFIEGSLASSIGVQSSRGLWEICDHP